MQAITPTLIGILDAMASSYGMEDQFSSEFWVGTSLGIANYGAIGRRVIKAYMLGTNGRVDRSARRHMPYNPIPLIHRPLSNPLTPIERQNLRLRTEQTINGIGYEFFYGKLLPSPPPISTTQYLNTATANLPYVSAPLNTAAANMAWEGVLARPTAVTISSTVTLPLNSTELLEIQLACDLLGITEISIRELGLIAGVDHALSDSGLFELDRSICTAHVSLSGPLLPPGLQLSLGQTMGLNI